jgi:hypothetical protein
MAYVIACMVPIRSEESEARHRATDWYVDDGQGPPLVIVCGLCHPCPIPDDPRVKRRSEKPIDVSAESPRPTDTNGKAKPRTGKRQVINKRGKRSDAHTAEDRQGALDL